MAYPPSLPPTNRTDSTLSADNHASDHNRTAAALRDIVAELGTNPAGIYADLDTRLARLDAAGAGTGGTIIVPLRAAKGPENTAAIQAALDKGGAVRIECVDSDTALITDTLTVGPRTTVYVECELQLTIGTTAKPLWQNRAHTAATKPVTSFTQAAWVDATVDPPGIFGTITVAAGHGLTVGDWVAIEGTTTSGYNGVFRISGTTATTLTVMMPFPAAATTAAGAAITYVKADTDIRIIGGSAFQDGSNQAFNPVDGQNCGSIWHRFHNLTIERMRVRDSKRYAWHIACGNRPVLRNLRVENKHSSGASDGVHFGGAVFNTILDGVSGFTGDDFVSLTIGDYTSIQMSKGDFFNTRISNLQPESVKGEIVKMTGGSGQFFFKDTVIDGVGGVGAVFVVQVYDDTSSGGTLLGTAGDRLVVRNVATSAQSVVYCNITGAFDSIEVDGVDANLMQNSKELVTVAGSSAVKHVSVRNVRKSTTARFLPHLVNLIGTANVGRVDISGCYIISGGTSGQYHYTVKHGCATLTHVSVSNATIQSGGASGGAIFTSAAGAGDGVTVTLRDVAVNQLDYLADFNTAGTLIIGPSVTATNLWAASRIRSNGSAKKLVVLGGPILPIRNKADLVVANGGLSDVMGDLYLDGAQVTTPVAGSRFYNTNAAWSSGSGTDKSGQYAYTGSAWTKLYGPA